MKKITYREPVHNRKYFESKYKQEGRDRVYLWLIAMVMAFGMGYWVSDIRHIEAVEASEGSTMIEQVEVATDTTQEVVEPSTPPTAPQEATVSVAAEVKHCEYCHIVDWVNATVSGSPVNTQYVDALYRASGEDLYLTRLAVAIAFAETTLGTHPRVTTTTNFMGYDIRNGYDPASVEEFATRLMRGLEHYRGVESDPLLASRYTGNDSTTQWMHAVNLALSQMGGVGK